MGTGIMLDRDDLDEMVEDLERVLRDIDNEIITVDEARGMICGYRSCHGNFSLSCTESALRAVLDFVLGKDDFKTRLSELIAFLDQEEVDESEEDEDDDDEIDDSERYQNLYWLYKERHRKATNQIKDLEIEISEKDKEIERLNAIISAYGKSVPDYL